MKNDILPRVQPSMKALKIVRKKLSVVIQELLTLSRIISASSSVLPGNFILMSSKASSVRRLSSSSLSRTAASKKAESLENETIFRIISCAVNIRASQYDYPRSGCKKGYRIRSTFAPEMAEFHQRASPEWPDFTE